MPGIIETKHLDISYEDVMIVQDLHLTIPMKKITALVGANGCGKSTILKAIARILKPQSGVVYVNGNAVHTQKSKEIAKQLAILPQNPIAPDGLTVAELVSFGRSPHQGGFATLTKKDKEKIKWALDVTNMLPYARRSVDQLSGGQKQRVWIAMALAQETEILLLDEPTTYLDIAHQYEVLSLLRRLNEQEGRTIVMVVHDLNHASLYSDYMVTVKDGKIVHSGSPSEVMQREHLYEVFGIHSNIIKDPRTGKPICLPYVLEV
ncbi:iron-dicitrate transporter ATP-binding subunit [Paenibacillus sp. FSL H8-0548]|uniref:ABC transporter ATP-binding protein n=1 Tax=Paenibacillus sp. FSL H8-0548 TaxID=1920422 RepID=UPI00096BDE1B|nr:ABC transporter ATP-binding protein [Paenibacillus sp. FSL H8-0548]OMF26731.1 iron-dicitrate transporter ATP-binding subunit [Paenibacillus sp. FSL H8-0548]